MRGGRDDDADGVHRTDEFAVIIDGVYAKLRGDTLARRAIDVDYGDQVGARNLRELLRVELSEVTDADNVSSKLAPGALRGRAIIATSAP
jgi:hypothetical protein